MADRKKTRRLSWNELVGGLENLEAGALHEVRVQREAIPIVFVPGVFETRLENPEGEVVWDPDDGPSLDQGPGDSGPTPAETLQRLAGEKPRPDYLRVSVDPRRSRLEGLIADPYENLTRALERHEWHSTVRLCFELPVHCFGYNWAEDISRSGRKLAQSIEELINEHAGKGLTCRRVIIVAHSSGGLVARAACLLHGASRRVLGMLRVDEPADGSPLLFRAMKAGALPGKNFMNNGLLRALAPTGKHVTPLVANLPGLLQLLPSANYRTSAGKASWLGLKGPSGSLLAEFPRTGDPVAELYLNHERYWCAVDKSLLVPEGDQTGSDTSEEQAWSTYTSNLDQARALHDQISGWEHESTFHVLREHSEARESISFRMENQGRRLKFGQPQIEKIRDCDPETILGPDPQTGKLPGRLYGAEAFVATLEIEDGLTVGINLEPAGFGGGDSASAAAESDGPGVSRRRVFSSSAGSLMQDIPLSMYIQDVIEHICVNVINQESGS